MAVDPKTLMNIALGVSTYLECEVLAVYLSIGTGLVTNLRDRNKEPREIAHEVLKTWARTSENDSGDQPKATRSQGRLLYEALSGCQLDTLKTLIEKFYDKLCGEGG